MGLLPDDPAVRADIANLYGCSGENPFAPLSHIGLDCRGAVQLVPEEAAHVVESRYANLVEVRDTDLEERLRLLRERASSPWGTSHMGRWSLGGAQSKMALRYQNGRWFDCEGSEPTTHILKPGVVGYNDQALDECLSQRVASDMGLPAAHVEYLSFGTEHAISIQRYDRASNADGTIARIHQEDLCQALGVDPSRKYAEQGGPSSPDVLALLGSTNANSSNDLRPFVRYLLFDYLIDATDAHAKNYSILLGAHGTSLLAPLYDVASTWPYQSLFPRQRNPLRTAMSLGGENRFGMLGEKTPRDPLTQRKPCEGGHGAGMGRLVRRTHGDGDALALQAVLGAASEARMDGVERIGPALARETSANCRRLLERL